MEPNNQTNRPQRIKFSKIINSKPGWPAATVFLAVVICVMLAAWKPWLPAGGSQERTISVVGESTLSAEPDEFIFYPSYIFKNADKEQALSELTKKSDELIKNLKKLGVSDNKIKSASSGYNHDYYFDRSANQHQYTLTLTVTTETREAAQKIQDYLLTTKPSGNVSPQAGFSERKREDLQVQARNEAAENARQKADQTARNMGFKIGKVKTIEDENGPDPVFGLDTGATTPEGELQKTDKLSVQPGENELKFRVKIVYYIK